MSEKLKWTVTITDPERASEWQAVFGTTTVEVRSPLPTTASIPGRAHASVYWLDLDSLDQEKRQALVAHIARKFHVPEYQVLAEFAHDPVHAVPILAEHCVGPAIPMRLIL